MRHLFHFAAAHALVNGIVFAINRQQRLLLPPRFGSEQLSGGNQTLLVRQPDGFAGLDGFVSRFQAGDTDNRTDHKVSLRMCRDSDQTRGAMHDLGTRQTG